MPPGDSGLERQLASIGKAPGSIVIPPGAVPPKINVVLYDKQRHEVRRDVAADKLADLPDDFRVIWIDVQGIGDKAVIEKLIATFDIPWLAMEDVLHSTQRPKVDTYDDARFIIARMFDRAGTCETDQLSIFVRGKVVLSFQERPGDPFDGIRQRLEHAGSQLRERAADYLVYRLTDRCVDSIFPELQRLSDSVDAIEEEAIAKPTARLIRDLHCLRRDLRILERVALGTRDAMTALVRDEEGFFADDTKPYLRDVLDHASQVVDLSHYYTSVANDIGQLTIGSLNVRLSQAMRILAGVTVVIMPLTLIVGIYGMNFDHMPELNWEWGYFGALGVILVVGAALTLWMWRIGWLRADE